MLNRSGWDTGLRQLRNVREVGDGRTLEGLYRMRWPEVVRRERVCGYAQRKGRQWRGRTKD